MYYSISKEVLTVGHEDQPDVVLGIPRPNGEASLEKSHETNQYAILITKSIGHYLAGKVEVRQAVDYEIIALRDWKFKDEAESQYLETLKAHLDNQMKSIFFSYDFDLTSNMQSKASVSSSSEKRYPFEAAGDQFLWNRFVSDDLISAAKNIDSRIGSFIELVIHGMVSLHDTTYEGSTDLLPEEAVIGPEPAISVVVLANTARLIISMRLSRVLKRLEARFIALFKLKARLQLFGESKQFELQSSIAGF
ncbi:hypothetical protein TRICI_001235 [Trichomonascus ciferrii]|uniref:SAC domain-containing protein n=1 Tax=Trichomonascus ciferrii TaxID=44093 RepID=A0A642VA96_9ASCO|nr:hypothetical protein TRICI_001235 [Trichomonascus ciferrii]